MPNNFSFYDSLWNCRRSNNRGLIGLEKSCYSDGTWVDGVAFGELADFIVRGGDLVAGKASETRARLSHRPAPGGTTPKSIFGRLMGSE